MASSVAQCKELVELAEKKQTHLMVGHTFIYTSVVRRIKEIVDKGDLRGLSCMPASRRLNLGLFQKDIKRDLGPGPHEYRLFLTS